MGDQHHLEDESKPSSSPEAVTFLFWNSCMSSKWVGIKKSNKRHQIGMRHWL